MMAAHSDWPLVQALPWICRVLAEENRALPHLSSLWLPIGGPNAKSATYPKGLGWYYYLMIMD